MRRAEIEFTKQYMKAKTEKLRKLVKKACKDATGAKIWNLVKQISPQTNKRRKKIEKHTEEAKQEAENIAKKFENIYNAPDLELSAEEEHEHNALIAELWKERQKQPIERITMRELDRAVKKANSKSAGGVDGIPNSLIKHMCTNPTNKHALLRAINNDIIDTGYFPQEMKIAKIRPLPKQKPGDYRPISLLPNMAKLIEGIIENRIRQQADKQIPDNQFGCRPAHSTTHALLRLLHNAGLAAAKEQQFAIIVYDFMKAFDRVQKSITSPKNEKVGN